MSRHAPSAPRRDADREPLQELVLGAALLMVSLHAALRAWAIYPSWFFTDDYRLMLDARGQALTFDYLVTPFDSQFMPVGRLLVWVVVHNGTTNWVLAASITVVLQLLAALSCLWMLVTLFGLRPAILAPLALYLTSAMNLPGYMWWAAALNQLPLQIVFFVAVTAWVIYLRDRSTRWLVITSSAVAIGLLCYVKTLLVIPVLAFILLAYFTQGQARERLSMGLRRFPVATIVGSVLGVGFSVFYALTVNQAFESSENSFDQALDTADSMLGTAIPTAAIGGPWRWFDTSPPIVLADPPAWMVHGSWALIALVVAYSVLRRERAGRAWALLIAYTLVSYGLLATSRGQIYGSIAGSELRYATDVLPVLVLALSLAALPLRGAVEASRARSEPALTIRVPPRMLGGLIAVVVVGGVISSLQYVDFWHERNASRDYVKTLQRDLRQTGPIDLADLPVPKAVMPDYTKPNNEARLFIPLVSRNARFPDVSSNLHVIDEGGSVRRAAVDADLTATPGPDVDCGWRIENETIDIPLRGAAFDFTWWVRLGYLASAPGLARVEIAGEVQTFSVAAGLNSTFVRVEAGFDTVAIRTMDPGVALCVGSVEVGNLMPEGSS